MREAAFLRLGTDPAAGVEWMCPGDAGGPAGVARGTLEEAARACAGRRLIVLVPSTAVLLAAADIPSRNQQRILQALPYMLEDQLATEVEALHFAPGERDEHGRVSVAVTEREQMDRWVGTLREAGSEPEALVPDVLALPMEEGAWTVHLHDGLALVRTGRQDGFAADADNLGTILPRALEEAAEARPRRVLVYGDGGGIDEERLAPIEIERRAGDGDEPLEVFARHVDERGAINLLQGRYSRREQLGRLWRPWLPSAALLGVLLLVNAGMTAVDYVQLSRASERLEQDIEQIYREAFPEARRVVNPRVQMERRLESLRAGGAGETAGFLRLLDRAAAPLKQTEGLTLQRISYSDGRLALALVIGDLQGLDQLKRRLAEEIGMEVEIQSATARSDGVEARLQLTGDVP